MELQPGHSNGMRRCLQLTKSPALRRGCLAENHHSLMGKNVVTSSAEVGEGPGSMIVLWPIAFKTVSAVLLDSLAGFHSPIGYSSGSEGFHSPIGYSSGCDGCFILAVVDPVTGSLDAPS